MGKPVTSNVKRLETTTLNTKVNKEVFDAFKDCCAEYGYSMNTTIETFMRQYANGRFHLETDDIMKFKNDGKEVDTLNTSFNKDIYSDFKLTCKRKRFFVKHVVMAFMEKFANKEIILEYSMAEEVNKNKGV